MSSGNETTRDFMSVDSFSQLPFIRPSPKPASSNPAASNIRLFGFEFPPDPHSKQQPKSASPDPAAAPNSTAGAAGGDKEASRKFECHYCCRNFPTSQALGGHQNAHKRERQHAKRAHLQSAMAAAQAHQHYQHHHQQQQQQAREGHVYGFLNYHRGCPPPHYPTWSSSTSGLGQVAQPIINGSPLPSLWRVPGSSGGGAMGVVVHRDASRPMPLPLFRGGGQLLDQSKSSQMRIMSSSSSASASASASASYSGSYPHDRRGCESGAKNHSVSLDLHL